MTRTRSTLLALLAVLMSPMTANADLIDLGDTTLDASTGLEWLDLTFTHGQSYLDLLAGFGGYFDDGWSVANEDEICRLFRTYGDEIGGCEAMFFVSGDTSGATGAIFVDFFGDTSGNGDAFGFWDAGITPDLTAMSVGHALMANDGIWENANAATYQDVSGPGFWMVREYVAVPEPGTLALLGIGLAGMGAARRRKKA